jgi:MFS family permease
MRVQAQRNIRLLTWFNFCDDFRVYNAIAIVYFADVTHSYALAGVIFAIAKVSAALFEIPTGILSDLVQRKFTLICGQVSSTLAVLCYALGGSLWLLAAGAAFEGLAFALFSGNNDALLYDTLKQEGEELRFALFQGRLSSMFQFSLAASALVATMMLKFLPFAALFWISLFPKLIGLALGAFLVEPARTRSIDTNIYGHLSESIRGFARDARLRQVTLAAVISWGLGESKFLLLPGFFALYWPAWALGIARFVAHLLAGTGFRLAGRVIHRVGEYAVFIAAMPFSMAMGLAAIATSNVASPALYSLSSLPFGPANVAQSSIMQKSFTDQQRATMASLAAFAGNLFFAVAIVGFGALADRVGLRYTLLAAELLSIPAVVIYWRLFRTRAVAPAPFR